MRRYNKMERIGVNAIERIAVKELGWIFREQPTVDLGVDAHIELVQKQETGKLIAVQIKTGRSHFHETNDALIYYGSAVHLEYWGGHSLPVVLVAYLPDTDEALWVAVQENTIKRTPTGWKIDIPKANKFGPATLPSLLALFDGPPKATRFDALAPVRFPDFIYRRELHRLFGGSDKADVTSSSQSSDVFVFCMDVSWETPGLVEGWKEDGCFHFMGERQTGNQRMRRANRTILEAANAGRTLRVFKGTSGKVEHQGRFELDATEPYYWRLFSAKDGRRREKIIFFRLRPIDIAPVLPDEAGWRRLALLTGREVPSRGELRW